MNNVALLIGDFVLYWNQMIVILGFLAGCVLVFALRPFARIRKKALLLWFLPAAILSFIFAKLLYYYCSPELFAVDRGSFAGLFLRHYHVAGFLLGSILAAVLMKRLHYVKHTRNLLDTTFPGVILTLALIRLSYLFTDTFHSTLTVKSPFWQGLLFAVTTTDAAGNTYRVFAPFFVSFLVLLLTVLVLTLFVRPRIKHPGDLFFLTFSFYALSEIVLESTRYDALKLHFILLDFLNPYMSFISFSMIFCGICLILVFAFKYAAAKKATPRKKRLLLLAVFVAGFLCFGICEYLVQRYTNAAALYHWLQTLFAAVMAFSIATLIYYRNANYAAGKRVLHATHADGKPGLSATHADGKQSLHATHADSKRELYATHTDGNPGLSLSSLINNLGKWGKAFKTLWIKAIKIFRP